MHPQAHDYIRSRVDGLTFGDVVEYGGRDINGTIKGLFDCTSYTSIDLYDGPGVDVVGDAAEWVPDAPVSAVVCCEVFEHAEGWPDMVAAAYGILEDGGHLLVTCATGNRPPHSALDGAGLKPDEWYRNVPQDELVTAAEDLGFTVLDVVTRTAPDDLYFHAVK